MNITDYVSERLDGASSKELQAIVASDMSHVGDDHMDEAIAAELVSQAKERLSALQSNCQRRNDMTPQQQASEWLLNCAILDTETTGLYEDAEIVEISIIDEQGSVLLDTLVQPLKPIPAEATTIHGITNDMVATAPSWADIHDEVCRIVSCKPLVIYNADYDMRLMAQTAALYGLQPVTATAGVHCAMLAYAEFYGDWNDYKGSYRWQRLTNAAAQQGVVTDGQAHRALADVMMTLGVLQAMARQRVGGEA